MKSFPRRFLLLVLIVGTGSIVVALTIMPQLIPKSGGSFSLTASPALLSIQRGTYGNSTINLTSIDGFAGEVELSMIFAGGGLAVALSPTTIALAANGAETSILTVSVSNNAATGQCNITITGTSGPLSSYVTVSVRL